MKLLKLIMVFEIALEQIRLDMTVKIYDNLCTLRYICGSYSGLSIYFDLCLRSTQEYIT